MRTVLTLVLFASTLVAVVARPRGIAAGWWTCGAAAIALALGLVHPSEVWTLILVAREALLFLLALLLLSALLELLWAGSGSRAGAKPIARHRAASARRAPKREAFTSRGCPPQKDRADEKWRDLDARVEYRFVAGSYR